MNAITTTEAVNRTALICQMAIHAAAIPASTWNPTTAAVLQSTVRPSGWVEGAEEGSFPLVTHAL